MIIIINQSKYDICFISNSYLILIIINDNLYNFKPIYFSKCRNKQRREKLQKKWEEIKGLNGQIRKISFEQYHPNHFLTI